MKVCGIIVEYNPFHNGHAYHAQMAKEKTNADFVIAVMSGNFLQRGEPAIIDKWSRAQAAVFNGVDLVIELPFEWAVQSADYFARGAMHILSTLGCDVVCFGTDTEAYFDYEAYGEFFKKKNKKIAGEMKLLNDPSLTYAQKMILVLKKINPKLSFQENQPNHLLAMSYAKENALLRNPMKLTSIQRKEAAYHSDQLEPSTIASATAIRKALKEGTNVTNYVPLETTEALFEHAQVSWTQYWPLLKYHVTVMTLAQLRNIYQMVDGLEYRFKKFINEATTFEEFIEKIQSKRYSKVRLQRLCVYTLMNITEEDLLIQQTDSMIRPLAYTESGMQFLKRLNVTPDRVISRFAKNESRRFSMTLTADKVYQLGNPEIKEQNFGRFAFVRQNSQENASQ